jgi:hypothetical protein
MTDKLLSDWERCDTAEPKRMRYGNFEANEMPVGKKGENRGPNLPIFNKNQPIAVPP